MPVWFIVVFVILMVGIIASLIALFIIKQNSNSAGPQSDFFPAVTTPLFPTPSPIASIVAPSNLLITSQSNGTNKTKFVTIQANTEITFTNAPLGTTDTVFGFRMNLPNTVITTLPIQSAIQFQGTAVLIGPQGAQGPQGLQGPTAVLFQVIPVPFQTALLSVDLSFRLSNTTIPVGTTTFRCMYQISYFDFGLT